MAAKSGDMKRCGKIKESISLFCEEENPRSSLTSQNLTHPVIK